MILDCAGRDGAWDICPISFSLSLHDQLHSSPIIDDKLKFVGHDPKRRRRFALPPHST